VALFDLRNDKIFNILVEQANGSLASARCPGRVPVDRVGRQRRQVRC
jgi:hypothetical protein